MRNRKHQRQKEQKVLLGIAVIVAIILFAYYVLDFEDIVGQATEVVDASACEPGKFYLASTGTLELCNCVGSSCARGSCEGAVCKKTKQITINPNGGKVTVRDPASSAAGDVIDAQTTIPLEVGTRREISLNPQQPSATSGVDIVFTGWKDGADATTTSRLIVVTKDADYTPNWREERRQTVGYMLSISKAGTGAGTVTSSPGINCGTECSATYDSSQTVTLTAAPVSGSVFAGWSGHCSGESSTCQVTMSAAKSVTATFNSISYTLSLTKKGSGSGIVASTSDVGVSCGNDCSEGYPFGINTILTATPADGSVFAGWSGPCGGTDACIVSMIEARSVSATFNPQTAPAETDSYALTVIRAGTGSGTVTGVTCNGIACGSFSAGTFVTLTATPAAGSIFSGWSEPSCGTSITCTIPMNAPKSVTASFAGSPITLGVLDAASKTILGADNQPLKLLGGSQSSACVFTHDQASSIIECVFPVALKESDADTPALRALRPMAYTPAIDYFIKAETIDVYNSITSSIISRYNDWNVESLFVEAISASAGVVATHLSKQSCSGTSCLKDFNYPSDLRMLRVIVRAVPHNAQLTVTTSGAGSVVSNPIGVDCGTDCSQVYERGARVTLTAAPGPNSVFLGWSGDACVGSQDPSCTVEMSTAKSVSAQFVEGYSLSVLFPMGAGGTVTSTSTPSQAGQLLCTSECRAAYPTGTSVVLTATPDFGFKFVGWGNACTGTGSCTILLDGPKQVSANFVPRFLLTVTVVGSGTVNFDNQINQICGNSNTYCSKEYEKDARATLYENPSSTSSMFVGWTSSSGNPCISAATGQSCALDMTMSKSVTAQFAAVYPLTVTNAGGGTVISDPPGISCAYSDPPSSSSPCAKSYPSGTRVTLTAAPDTGSNYMFAGWSGDACAGSLSLTCTVDMASGKTVGARFAEIRTLTVGVAGKSGRVTSSPSGIDCIGDGTRDTSCSANFGSGTRITLTATGEAGSTFGWWSLCASIDASIEENKCTLTLNQDRAVWASFK